MNINKLEETYLVLLSDVRHNGTKKDDRTGTGTVSKFGYQMRFDLSEGFPLLTTKKMHLKSIIHELLWMLMGDTNISYLQMNGVKIWDEWADENGELGPVYGHQWRSWETRDGGSVDQIRDVVRSLIQSPDSRRHIVSAWNVAEISEMALPPCHMMFQFYVTPSRPCRRECVAMGITKDCNRCNGTGHEPAKLSCQLYQRSADIFLGLPFNIASYALLTMMVAQVTGLQAHEFIHTIGDAHLYLNHFEAADTQLIRDPYSPPKMIINPEVKDIFSFKYDDFKLENYRHHDAIKAEVSV